MANSSDEDLNSENEEIDLSPLWRSRPFLSESSSTEDEAEYPPRKDTEAFRSPKLVLTPINSSESKDETLMTEINDVNTRATTAKRPNSSSTSVGSQEQINSTYSPRTWSRVGFCRYRLHYADGQASAPIMPFVDEEVIPRRSISPFVNEQSHVTYHVTETDESLCNPLQ